MDDWRSYDRTAETYERVHAPRFADVARDLAAFVEIGAGTRVLDIGTGTGVGAAEASALGASATGLDRSLAMVTVGRDRRPEVRFVAGEAIDLPFRDATFDAVLGSFVLAHFTKVETALFDIARVTRPGGVVGFSTWADDRDAFTDTWRELVLGVVPEDMLEQTLAKAIPHHDRFRRREAIEESLIDAGLRHVRTEPRRFEWSYARDDYVDGLTTWAIGRFVREMLGEDDWKRFMDRAHEVFAARFPDPLHDIRDVLFARATKE